MELIETEEIRPAMVVGVPVGFLGADLIKARLQDCLIANIRINGRKGSAVVASAIMNGLVDLAWKAYGQEVQNPG